MKVYLILILVFFLALLQAAFLNLNLVLLLVLTWAVFRPPREVILVAFASGLMLDLALGKPLGFYSLAFLLASFLLLLYRRRFDSLHPLFLPLFVFLTAYLIFLFEKRFWFCGSCLLLAFLALGVRYLLVFLIGRVDRGQIKLR
jgi:rod shape-determining protein MreD